MNNCKNRKFRKTYDRNPHSILEKIGNGILAGARDGNPI